MYLIDRELVDAQNIAYFGKTGVMSNIVFKISVKDKQVIGYCVEGKISGGGVYSFDLEFLPTEGLNIDIPLQDDDLVDIF